eukprot:SAG11_NODE_1444_length_4893_cov_7.649979_8_plen_87_part_00
MSGWTCTTCSVQRMENLEDFGYQHPIRVLRIRPPPAEEVAVMKYRGTGYALKLPFSVATAAECCPDAQVSVSCADALKRFWVIPLI